MFLIVLVAISGLVIVSCVVGALYTKVRIVQVYIFLGPAGAIIGFYLGSHYELCVYPYCLPPEGCAIVAALAACWITLLIAYGGDRLAKRKKLAPPAKNQLGLLSALLWEDYPDFQKHLEARNMMVVLEGDPRVRNWWRSCIPQFWLKHIILKVDYATEREGYFVGYYDFETKTAKIKREVIRSTRFFRMRLGPGRVGFIAVSAITMEPRTIFYEAYIDLKKPYAVGGPLPDWFFATPLH